MVNFKLWRGINDNTYKIDILGEFYISATFIVAYLPLFDTSFNLRLKPFEDREYDVSRLINTSKD